MVFVPRWSKFNRQPSGLITPDRSFAPDFLVNFANSPEIDVISGKEPLAVYRGKKGALDSYGLAGDGSTTGYLSHYFNASGTDLLIVVNYVHPPTDGSSYMLLERGNFGPIYLLHNIDQSGASYSSTLTNLMLWGASGNCGIGVELPKDRDNHTLSICIDVSLSGSAPVKWVYLDGRKITAITQGPTSFTPTTLNPNDDLYFNSRGNSSFKSKGQVNLAAFFNKKTDEGLAQELTRNPWQLFKPRRKYWTLANLAARYGRPTSDLSAGAWTPSTGSDLYAMVDESTYSDADYISTSSASTCSLALNGIVDPASSSGHVIRYRAKNSGSGSITVTLKQGATTIASSTNSSLTTSYADYSFTLSGAEADSITDYTNLKLELTSA